MRLPLPMTARERRRAWRCRPDHPCPRGHSIGTRRRGCQIPKGRSDERHRNCRLFFLPSFSLSALGAGRMNLDSEAVKHRRPGPTANRDDRMCVWVTLPHPFGVGRAKFTRSRDERGVSRPRMSARLAVESLAARAAGKLVAPRGRGRRHDAAGQAALEARSERNRRARSPVAGRSGGRLRHQRQDDDHRHGRRDPRTEAPSRLEPLGREPRLRRRVDAADAA